MKEPKTLPSSLKIAAEIDAALAAAGLTGPQVEREALPLYLSFIEEMIDAEGKLFLDFHHASAREVAQGLVTWGQKKGFSEQGILSRIAEHLEETLLLTHAHGTLSDMKRRKLLNLNQQIIDFTSQLFSQQAKNINERL